jgi:hypothetical protein
MRSKTETAARRLVAEIYRATHDGRPQRWCNLSQVCERTGANPDVVQLAALKGWIDLAPKDDPHSVTLSESGRLLVAPPTRPARGRPIR